MSFVEFKNYYKTIKNKVILNNLNGSYEAGKIYCIVGENGSGKTMLLRAISGLILPSKGKVLIGQKEIGRDISFPESIGMIIENPGFWDYFTGFENLRLLAGIKNNIGINEIESAMEKVGLKPADDRIVRKYSLGMKQRLGIAQAIMEKPDLILLDEPTNALDENGIQLIRNIMIDERERGATLFVATHDKKNIEDIADEFIYVKDGEVIREDEKNEQ